jgi:hypothetical protein
MPPFDWKWWEELSWYKGFTMFYHVLPCVPVDSLFNDC